MGAPFLISVAIFGALTLLILGVSFYFRYVGERRKLLARAGVGGQSRVFETADGSTAAQGLPFRRHVQNIAAKLGDFIRPKSEEQMARINQRFVQAGHRSKNMVIIFFGAKVLCASALSLSFLSLHLFITRHITTMGVMIISLGLVAAGFYLPNLWLSLKVSSRKEKLSLGLPDALDLLVVCVEAGMGLDSAITRVGEEMKLSSKAISDEFRLLNLELRAGKSRRDALKNLGLRTGLDDVNSLTTLLIQTEKFGTNIGQALRVHSDSMRTKRTQRVEEVAAKLPLKLLFPTIFFIFPSLFVVLLGPALLRAFRIWAH